MRYLFRLLCVCVLGVAPLRVSAQDAEEGTTSESNLQEPAPSSEFAPEEPALQLKLDAAGVEVVPSTPRTVDGYTLEEMDVRVKRARAGLILSSFVMVVGAAVAIGGAISSLSIEPSTDSGGDAVTITGVSLWAGGSAGMIATGILLGRRNRNRDRLLDDYYKLGLQPPSPDDDEEPLTPTEPSGLRGPAYRPH